MASGHYERRRILNPNPNGPDYIDTYVWVPDPVSSPTKAVSQTATNDSAARAAQIAAQKRAADAARLSAERAARDAAIRRARQLASETTQEARARADKLRLAYKQKIAEARRTSYENLKARQKAIIATSFQTQRQKSAAQASNDQAESAFLYNRDRRIAQQSAEAARAASHRQAQAAEQARWEGIGKQWLKKQAIDKGAVDPQSAKQLEQMLAEELLKAQQTGVADTETITKLREQYEKYAQKVYDDYEKMVAAINAALDAGNVEKARSLYQGDFLAMQAEFVRMFGDGRDAQKDGAYNQFQQVYQQISDQQREWWKKQMQASLQSQLDRAERIDSFSKYGEDPAKAASGDEARSLLDLLSGKVETSKVIDHYETSEDSRGALVRKPVYRQLSIDEEVQKHFAEQIMKAEQLRAQYEAGQMRQKALFQAEGLVDYQGQAIDRRQVPIVKAAQALVDSKFNGTMPQFKDPKQLQAFADQLVSEWAKQNPRPAGPAKGSLAQVAWDRARANYEQSVYSFFGTNTPGFLERGLQAPVVSHALAILQAGFSTLGASARVLNASVFGESKVGGFTPELELVPDEIKAQMEAAAEKASAEFAAVERAGGQEAGARSQAVRTQLMEAARAQVLYGWLATPDGQQWVKADLARQRGESAVEDAAFVEGFYGKNGDLGSGLDALNTYGNAPTSNEGVNLLSSLLLDPFNAIPLKFTTYLSRGKYALEAAGGASKALKSPLQLARDFSLVDEGTLNLRKFMSKFDKELARNGWTVEKATDAIREQILGLTEKSAIEVAVQKFMRQVGIDARKVSETELFNFAESIAVKQAAEQGVNLYTAQQKLADDIAAHEAKVAAEKASKAARKRAEEAKVVAELQVKQDLGKKARATLAKARAEQAEQLKAIESKPKAPPKPVKPAIDVSGASDNATDAAVSRAVVREVKARTPKRREPSYVAADEFYDLDPLGNRVPLVIKYDDELHDLVKRAEDGDMDARRAVALRARHERNQFRMHQQDMAHGDWRPTEFDVAEAGGVTEGVAAKRLTRDRRTLREIKLRASTKNADDFVSQFTLAHRGAKVRLIDKDADVAISALDDAALPLDRVTIGHDILAARETTLRGLHDIYEPFSHANLDYYLSGPKRFQVLVNEMRRLQNPEYVLKELQTNGFMRIMVNFADAPAGIGSFRDYGQWVFEVFHQLRLAKDWDKLREFSNSMQVVLRDDPTNVFAWMWKVMEDRVGLPYAFHPDDVAEGFLHAAEEWNLHPELAMAMIPWGYGAKRPPLSFGLSAKLEGAAAKPWFHAAPRGWKLNNAKDAVTRLFARGEGDPTQIVQFMAEKYGDLLKAGPLRARMLDELAFSALHGLGVDVVRDALVRQHRVLDPALVGLADRRIIEFDSAGQVQEALTGILDQILTSMTKRRGAKDIASPRPDFRQVREAVERAYWAGELPINNARAHTLMFLTRLQSKPDLWRGATAQFAKYMRAAGAEQAWREVIAAVFDNEIRTVVVRAAGEGSYVDDLFTRTLREMDALPKISDIASYTKNRVKALNDLATDAFEDAKRAEWLQDGSELPSAKYTGTVDFDGTIKNIESMFEELRATKSARVAAKRSSEVEGQIRGLIYRIADTGGANFDQDAFEQLGELAARLREYPEMVAVFHRLQQDMGETILSGRIAGAAEPLAHREALLRLRLKWMEEGNGSAKIRPGFEAAARKVNLELEQVERAKIIPTMQVKVLQIDEKGSRLVDSTRPLAKSRRIDLDAMRKQYEAEAVQHADGPPTIEPHTAPAGDGADLAASEGAFSYIFKMTETEWYAFEKARIARVLQSKTESLSVKKAARARRRLIEQAEYVLNTQRRRGVRITWKERDNFSRRVNRRHGKKAEDYYSEKMVAPMVRNAGEASVEQARTYFRLLKSAAPGDVPGADHIRMNGVRVDHIPKAVWDEVEAEVTKAINEARGFKNELLTRKRGPRGTSEESSAPLGALKDDDPLVIRAKTQALQAYFKRTGTWIPVPAYDAVRKTLFRGFVQNKTALYLLNKAEKIAAKGGKTVEQAFRELRKAEAAKEARRQLKALAFGEMYGVDPDVVFDTFVSRYGDDGTLKKFTPELTSLQRRTLEEHFRTLAGAGADDAEASIFLQSANRPPFESRELTREFLKDIGAWSPRTTEAFIAGKQSWSVWAEADYWRTSYGFVPEWADMSLLRGDMNVIFHDQNAYLSQMKKWGIFNRSHELALRIEGKTAKEIEEGVLNSGRRALDQQRQYVIDRYGPLVSKDGQTLDAMPWLMYPNEYKRYMANQIGGKLPEGLVQTPAELEEVQSLIQIAMKKPWEEIVEAKVARGEQIDYNDMFAVASAVQVQLLANPKWARRWRDVLGKGLDAWSWMTRWMVFSNPAFAIMNVVDAPIKGYWYRMTRRGLFNDSSRFSEDLIRRAEALTPEQLGRDTTPAVYRVKEAPISDRLKNPRGFSSMERTVDRALALVEGTGSVFPSIAGHAELTMQMRLARGMYPTVYTELLKKYPEELAHTLSLSFIKKEINKMWPTAGDGPIERLWNRLIPFASYTIKNKVLFLSEALAHPAILNYIERIGAAIERENTERWERENPGVEMPPEVHRLMRQIELPWAKGYYIDLSQFSDASRGLKPLLTGARWKSNAERIGEWLRLVNPAMQAGIYAVFNAFNLFPKTGWVAVYDKNGFPTGDFKLVTVPYNEPWSNEPATFGSMFWFAETVEQAMKDGINGFTSGEASALIGQVFLFNAIETYDRYAVLNSFFFGLSKADQKKFLETENGKLLKAWWLSRVKPSTVLDRLSAMERFEADPASWFHDQSPEFQSRVKEGRDKVNAIRDLFAEKLAGLQSGTAEYREMRGRMYLAINAVYTSYPELLQSEVWSKSPSEWASQLADWQTDELMDRFMALSGQRPKRSAFASVKAFNAAVADWEHQKQLFLAQYPQVKAALSNGPIALENLREKVEKTWDAIFNRISARNERIEAAKAILDSAGRKSAEGAAAQEQLDALYLANELDYSLLERDYSATYFDDADFEALPFGKEGPLRFKGGVPLLGRVQVLMDFDKLQYEKARREGTLDVFLAKQAYSNAMKAATLAAKHGDPFGKFDVAVWMNYMNAHPDLMNAYFQNSTAKRDEWAKSARYVEGIRSLWDKAGGDAGKWVKLLKSDPWLLNEYFKRNPEKRAIWAKTDAYIREISVWGKLVASENWEAARKAWDSLPQWVKDEYYKKHPGKREAAAKTVEYLGYMDQWVKLVQTDKSKSLDFFQSMPDWVKERYYKKHPDKRALFSLDAKMQLQLRDYFAGDDQYRSQYLADHPQLGAWLAQYASSEESQRWAILAAYQLIPKEDAWLRRVYREKYPEIFSNEAKGEIKLRRVYDRLVDHPDMLPSFEKWVAAAWASYAEMLKHPLRPKWANVSGEREDAKRRRKSEHGTSAAISSR